MFALHPRLAHLPNNPGTRAIVLDPDMVIWSGGGKRVTALPHGHLLQDADRIIGGVYITWFNRSTLYKIVGGWLQCSAVVALMVDPVMIDRRLRCYCILRGYAGN